MNGKHLLILIFVLTSSLLSQDLWKYFSPEDYEKRRASLMENIADGIALFVAAELPEPFAKFYQDNTFST